MLHYSSGLVASICLAAVIFEEKILWRRFCIDNVENGSMSSMKKTRKKISAMLNAITFAECGEHETAHEFLLDSSKDSKRDAQVARTSSKKAARNIDGAIDGTLAAMTFAEEGLYQEACNLMNCVGLKTVLLVIEGEFPTEAAFIYARNLCSRTGAQMDILQIIDLPSGTDCCEILGQKMSSAVTNIIQLLQKANMQTSMPRLTIRLGEVDSKLLNYVKRHKEVSAIVLDHKETHRKNIDRTKPQDFFESLSRKLAAPLMTVLDRTSSGVLG